MTDLARWLDIRGEDYTRAEIVRQLRNRGEFFLHSADTIEQGGFVTGGFGAAVLSIDVLAYEFNKAKQFEP